MAKKSNGKALRKKKILGTGLSGLVGSRIVELLHKEYEFIDLSLDTGIDIRERESVFRKVEGSDAEFFLHMAAKTDVDGCESEKELGEKSQTWQVNVEGTRNVVDASRSFGKKVLYISTDFVFDGENGPYCEEDKPNPTNYYALTKYEGEKIVHRLSKQSLICRISYPYRSRFPSKLDVVRGILDKLKKRETVYAISDHWIVPTFIDDIAKGIEVIIESRVSGIFHLVGSQAITPFELAKVISKVFGIDGRIEPIPSVLYYRDRARRPSKSILKNDKMGSLGVRFLGVEDGVREVKKQLETNRSFSL